MGRTSRDKRPYLRPVERIELNEEHTGRRLIAAGVLLVIGAALIVYAFMRLMTPNTGWQAIQASSSAGASCASDFTLLYEVGSTAEAKGVTTLYTASSRRAFQLFHSDEEFEGVVNVCTINRHPNEELVVDEGLYKAFSVIEASGRRELYLGPIYNRYDDLFFCQDDAQLVDFDPRLSEAVQEEYAAVLPYANDPQSVRVELLGENRVRLNVSKAYLTWAEQESITRFIDFSWMRNAFIADYLAGELTAGGYTKGTLSSYDGFTRNLDERDVDHAYPIYHRQGKAVCPAAELRYRTPVSLVQMRDYPLSQQDFQQYYELRSGEIRTLYLDTADALCKSAVDTLLCYSREKGCAQLLMEMIPVYITDEFQKDALAALTEEKIQSVYCQDSVIFYTEPEIVLENFFAQDSVQYTAEQISLS